MTRRWGEAIGAMGTSVTYVAGTYSGFVLLAAPILRTCQRANRNPNAFPIFSHVDPLSSTKRQPAHLRPEHCVEMQTDAMTKPTTSLLTQKVNIFLPQDFMVPAAHVTFSKVLLRTDLWILDVLWDHSQNQHYHLIIQSLKLFFQWRVYPYCPPLFVLFFKHLCLQREQMGLRLRAVV